jgi:hypothetical protein
VHAQPNEHLVTGTYPGVKVEAPRLAGDPGQGHEKLPRHNSEGESGYRHDLGSPIPKPQRCERDANRKDHALVLRQAQACNCAREAEERPGIMPAKAIEAHQ